METVVLNGLYFPFVDLLSSVALAVVLGYGGHLYFQGAITLGTLFAFMLYVQNFFDPVQQLSQLYGTFLSATAALDKIVGRARPGAGDRRPARRGRSAGRGDVALRGRAFGYGDGPEVLHGLDLDVPAGTTVALVGHTGAGKSTIAKLLARFYDPREGRITIDGRDLRDVTQARCAASSASCRRRGSSSPAPSPRTSPSAGRTRRRRTLSSAAETIGAHEFILRLEDGYETELQERGRRLSLGQRQLVALARALLADPRILILDEATSSVDIGTERKIERALRTLLAGRTAFVIAHRLSTIRDADLIVVLEHGQIVEQGTHDELMRAAGSTRRSTATGLQTWPDQQCHKVRQFALEAWIYLIRGIERSWAGPILARGVPRSRAQRARALSERSYCGPTGFRVRLDGVLCPCLGGYTYAGVYRTDKPVAGVAASISMTSLPSVNSGPGGHVAAWVGVGGAGMGPGGTDEWLQVGLASFDRRGGWTALLRARASRASSRSSPSSRLASGPAPGRARCGDGAPSRANLDRDLAEGHRRSVLPPEESREVVAGR